MTNLFIKTSIFPIQELFMAKLSYTRGITFLEDSLIVSTSYDKY